MKTLLKISFRNLVRQKRRNILLGIGIAFGMSILIISNAFSQGMSELLLNRFVLWITGHMRVTMIEKDNREWHIIRDKDRLEAMIRQNIPVEVDIFEDVTTEGRALGNGQTESLMIKGIEMGSSSFQSLKTSAGNSEDLLNPAIENPIMLYEEIAHNLNVGVNDQVQVGFQTVYNQMQAARFTVVAILKGGLPFIDSMAYTHVSVLKPLLGYEPHETAALNVVVKDLKNPTIVREYADQLHNAFTPDVAGYVGMLRTPNRDAQARLFAVNPDEASRQILAANVKLLKGSFEQAFLDESSVMISDAMAQSLNLAIGDDVSSNYGAQFGETVPDSQYRVAGIFHAAPADMRDVAFVHPRQFYHTFFRYLPQKTADLSGNPALSQALLTEWTLLDRSADDKALALKYDELSDSNWRGAVLDVQTMYELARMVLNLELAMDIATSVAVMVLFAIILIGVINTLRMTIRERTREIGTVRAIGMQQRDVRWSFLLEVLLMAVMAGVVGIGLGYLAMGILSRIPMEPQEGGLLLFILVDKHLYFLPTLGDMLRNLGVITLLAFATAFFPSAKAARMSVCDALRSYE